MITKEEFHQLQGDLDEKKVQLVAVSKTKPIEMMYDLSRYGQIHFGENRIEEINRKAPVCPSNYRWHLIGPIQSKKVKLVGKNIHLFHALDRLKIWRLLDDHCQEIDHQMDALIQVHIGREETKHGFNLEEVIGVFEQKIQEDFKNIRIRGLMGMATFTDDQNIVRSEFDGLKRVFDQIKDQFDMEHFDLLSMGMSGDYQIAIDAGSNMVRIGSKLFGSRD